jgi:tetratricopeptide (TPR) repeat protein
MDVTTGKTISATFAREAAECLREGDVHRAMELCTEGTRAYPDYAMGHVVLGRCYEAFGRPLDALGEYRKALSTMPDNPTLIALVQRAEQKERGAFQRVVAEQETQPRETTSPPAAQTEKEPPAQTDPTIEHLTRELERRRREKHPPAIGSAEAAPPPAEHNHAIVTPTTAEIFAGQQLYEQALRIYRELEASDPGRYTARIRELERLATEKGNKKAP